LGLVSGSDGSAGRAVVDAADLGRGERAGVQAEVVEGRAYGQAILGRAESADFERTCPRIIHWVHLRDGCSKYAVYVRLEVTRGGVIDERRHLCRAIGTARHDHVPHACATQDEVIVTGETASETSEVGSVDITEDVVDDASCRRVTVQPERDRPRAGESRRPSRVDVSGRACSAGADERCAALAYSTLRLSSGDGGGRSIGGWHARQVGHRGAAAVEAIMQAREAAAAARPTVATLPSRANATEGSRRIDASGPSYAIRHAASASARERCGGQRDLQRIIEGIAWCERRILHAEVIRARREIGCRRERAVVRGADVVVLRKENAARVRNGKAGVDDQRCTRRSRRPIFGLSRDRSTHARRNGDLEVVGVGAWLDEALDDVADENTRVGVRGSCRVVHFDFAASFDRARGAAAIASCRIVIVALLCAGHDAIAAYRRAHTRCAGARITNFLGTCR